MAITNYLKGLLKVDSLSVFAQDPSGSPFYVKGASGQSARIAIVQDFAGNNFFDIDSSGNLHAYKNLTVDGVGQRLFVRRTTDSTAKNSNTTYAADDTLLLPLAANATYKFKGFIAYTTSSAAGIATRFSYTGSVASSYWTPNGISGTSGTDTAGVRRVGGNIGTGFGLSSGVSGGTTFLLALPFGIISTTTAGNLTFDWAQYVSDAGSTIVKGNSYLEAERVA